MTRQKQQTPQKKEKEKSKTVEPGDIRANKGYMFLKDAYIPVFRQPYFQGLPESIVPVLMMRLLAGFTRQWQTSESIAIVWLCLLLKYFTLDYKELGLQQFQTYLTTSNHVVSTVLSYALLATYAGASLFFYNEHSGKSLDHVWFMIAVYLLTDVAPRCAPKSLTFSEAFTLATLLTVYAGFCLDQIRKPVMTSVGNPTLNAAMFAPWLSIVIFLCLLYATSFLLKPSVAFLLSFASAVALLLNFYFTTERLMERLLLVLTHQNNVQVMAYMAITLLIGLFVLYDLS